MNFRRQSPEMFLDVTGTLQCEYIGELKKNNFGENHSLHNNK